jgi:hypothetical protein
MYSFYGPKPNENIYIYLGFCSAGTMGNDWTEEEEVSLLRTHPTERHADDHDDDDDSGTFTVQTRVWCHTAPARVVDMFHWQPAARARFRFGSKFFLFRCEMPQHRPTKNTYTTHRGIIAT